MATFDEALTKTTDDNLGTALALIATLEPDLGEKTRKVLFEAAKRLSFRED